MKLLDLYKSKFISRGYCLPRRELRFGGGDIFGNDTTNLIQVKV